MIRLRATPCWSLRSLDVKLLKDNKNVKETIMCKLRDGLSRFVGFTNTENVRSLTCIHVSSITCSGDVSGD